MKKATVWEETMRQIEGKKGFGGRQVTILNWWWWDAIAEVKQ